MKIDLNKHKEAYLNEAKAHIKNMNLALVELEKSPQQVKLFHDMFRAVHTLKSLAAMMSYNQTMQLCHALEDLLDAIRHEKSSLDKCSDLFFQCFDYLSINLKKLEKEKEEFDAQFLIYKLQNLLTLEYNDQEKNFSAQIEPYLLEKIKSIDVKVERLDILMNLTEELLVNKMKFDVIREQVDCPELTPAVESLGRLITDLQYHVMQVRLIPIGFVFNRFPRMIRDLAKQQKKEINLQIEGADIELDRALIDEIGESITHLVRNAVDHGLETPEVRKKLNKSSYGTIKLTASRSKEIAIIEVSDDGAGLDLLAIKNLAVKQQFLKSDAPVEDAKNFIFSGLSTNKQVTPLSGRGLGLSIVKQKIESIGGIIKVESIPNKGTTFFIEIPLTLAIIKTLFVKVAGEMYAIPIDIIERLLVVSTNDLKGLLNHEAIIFEETDIPVLKLAKLFNKLPKMQLEKQPIIIISKDEERLGLAVDELLSTQEIIIKPLNRSIGKNKYFSGAALTGSGEMVLILDVAHLLSKKNLYSIETTTG